jgi:hypothetical protein
MKTASTEITESINPSTHSRIPSNNSPSETNPKPEIPPPPFPFAQLPEVLRTFATHLATTSEVSVPFAATTCLGVLSASLGTGAIHHDGQRRIRPNLYLLTVAPPTLDTTTCHRLAYAPLNDAQAQLDQATGPQRQPELHARRAQLLSAWSLIANNPRLSTEERETRLFQNNLEQQQLLLETESDPHRLLTHVPRGKLHAHLLTRPSVSLVNPDATRSAQILCSRISAHALDEQTCLAARSGTPITAADRTHHLRTVLDPCLTLHWTLPPEDWDEILTAKATAKSPLLPHFLYLKSEACPRRPEEILATPPDDDEAPGSADISSAPSAARSAHLSTPDRSQEAPSNLSVDVHPIPRATTNLSDPSIPLDPATIPESIQAHWTATIQTLLTRRLAETPVEYPITPEAQATLKAYETEIRTQIRNCPNPLQTKFIAHHPETAWRLALLLHATEQASPATGDSEIPISRLPLRSSHSSSAHSAVNPNAPNPSKTDQIRNPQSAIRNQTALAAIALTRFFSDHHRQLAHDLQTLPDQALLERVVGILEETSNGYLLVGQLRDRHHITPAEALRLAQKFPKLLQYKSNDLDGPGRPSCVLSLHPDYPCHPCPNSACQRNLSERLKRHFRPAPDPVPPGPASTESSASSSPPPANISEPPSPIGPIGPIGPAAPLGRAPRAHDSLCEWACPAGLDAALV